MRRGTANPVPHPAVWAAAAVAMLGALSTTLVYMGLAAPGYQPSITAPMLVASDTKPVYFECRDNTVFKPEIEDLQDRALAAFEKCYGGNSSRLGPCATALATSPVKNDYYEVNPVAIRCPGSDKPTLGMTFIEVPRSKGETLAELQHPNSSFRRELARLDPKRSHIYFVVRTDSFIVFHAARDLAKKLSFRAGWGPFGRDAKLGTGCGGGGGGGGTDTQGPQ